MLISGGENIYAAEVEKIFREHPAVADAALIGVPDETWGETGVMFIVTRGGSTVTSEELRAFADGRLARYKIPKEIIPFMFSKISYDKSLTLKDLPELRDSKYAEFKKIFFMK